MARGGARVGAGRKPGKPDLPKLRDFWSEKQIKDFFKDLYERAKTSDRIAVYCAEQITGKASQAIDVTSQGEKLQLILPHEIAGKCAPNTKTE